MIKDNNSNKQPFGKRTFAWNMQDEDVCDLPYINNVYSIGSHYKCRQIFDLQKYIYEYFIIRGLFALLLQVNAGSNFLYQPLREVSAAKCGYFIEQPGYDFYFFVKHAFDSCCSYRIW